ncbi:MAG: hypothetical protein HC880_08065 [Bacteroidia bacterium]|nr:hypothetical protein [Bacteroidia bacterium]
MGVIQNPNADGVACNYISDGIYLGGRHSRRGLPNFITSLETFGIELSTYPLRLQVQRYDNQVLLQWHGRVEPGTLHYEIGRSTAGLPPGWYWLWVQTSERSRVKRVLVE